MPGVNAATKITKLILIWSSGKSAKKKNEKNQIGSQRGIDENCE